MENTTGLLLAVKGDLRHVPAGGLRQVVPKNGSCSVGGDRKGKGPDVAESEKLQVSELVLCRGVPAEVVDYTHVAGTTVYWVRFANGRRDKALPTDLRRITEPS
jgi:hypothetical protein